MTEPLEALKSHLRFMRDQESVRSVQLSRAARQGLARLISAGKVGPASREARPVAAADRATAAPTPRPGSSAGTPPVAARSYSAPIPPKPVVSQVSEAPIEISGSSKVEQLRHLAERASVCVKCPHLVARRHNVVFGVGNPEARLMFVGEAPGEDEDLQGEPFVGRAGQLLTKMIIAMGLTREEIYIGNIVKCRPDMPVGSPGNRKPTKQEMDTCVPYLRAQIEVIKPTVLVALGATAVEGLLGLTASMGSMRGRFHDYRGIPVMPTYHPSYLLRNQSNTEKRKVWEDLLMVMERLELPISEKQRNYFLSKV